MPSGGQRLASREGRLIEDGCPFRRLRDMGAALWPAPLPDATGMATYQLRVSRSRGCPPEGPDACDFELLRSGHAYRTHFMGRIDEKYQRRDRDS